MILVRKPVEVPTKLKKGAVATTKNCTAITVDLHAFRAGSKSFEFKKTVYGHASVKGLLKKIQYSKCCYCEGKFEATSSGDVEHFRPKKGVYQAIGSKIENPGYYWLAYEWTNLYFSCEICNRSHKKSFFPLEDVNKRARIHRDDINAERPLLLDPGGPDDPRDHIHFHADVAFGVTPKGRRTVDVLKLDRESLNAERRDEAKRLKEYKELISAFEQNPQPKYEKFVKAARLYLARAVKPDAKFSAMAQDTLR
jgi:uncharacterized protein (TIGR02646 family)